jgi:hypothetical protein
VIDRISLLSCAFRPLSDGIKIVGNATDIPKSRSKRFLAELARICGRTRRNVLISCFSFIAERLSRLSNK